MQPLVSIITPTYGREVFLSDTLRWFESQTYPNLEWLVLDDSPQPCRLLAAHADPRIRYVHQTERLTIGEKRNRLVAAAHGEYIAHFDDDDYYSPRYVETMVGQLREHSADFANLGSWYLYDVRHDFFAFWALKQVTGIHYHCYLDTIVLGSYTPENNAALRENYLGYGFSYVYRRQVWEHGPFGAVNWCEEGPFIQAARQRYKLLSVEDVTGLALHLLHAGSTSSCFPQYHLPTFLVPVLFPEARGFIGRLRQARSAALVASPAGRA